MLSTIKDNDELKSIMRARVMYTYARYGKHYGPIDSMFIESTEDKEIITKWNLAWMSNQNKVFRKQMSPYNIPYTPADGIRYAAVVPWQPKQIPENCMFIFVIGPIETPSYSAVQIQPVMVLEQMRKSIKREDSPLATEGIPVDMVYMHIPKHPLFELMAETIASCFEVKTDTF